MSVWLLLTTHLTIYGFSKTMTFLFNFKPYIFLFIYLFWIWKTIPHPPQAPLHNWPPPAIVSRQAEADHLEVICRCVLVKNHAGVMIDGMMLFPPAEWNQLHAQGIGNRVLIWMNFVTIVDQIPQRSNYLEISRNGVEFCKTHTHIRLIIGSI